MEPVAHALEDADPLEGVQTGEFAFRAIARIIDWLLHIGLGFLGGMFGALVAAALAGVGAIDPDWAYEVEHLGFVWNMAWGLGAALIYEVLCEGIAGTTVGKLILGYRVVSTDLRPCTPAKAIIRSLAYFVDSFFCGIVAYTSMSSSALNQRYGDKWADTIVAQSATLPPSARRPPGLVALGLIAGAAFHAFTVGLSIILAAL